MHRVVRSFGPAVPGFVRGLRHPVRARQARIRQASRVSAARRLVDALCGLEHDCLSAGAFRIEKHFMTAGDVLVTRIRSGETGVVLKLATTDMAEQSFARHREAVTRIHALPALADVKSLVPRVITWGRFENCSYLMETALGGEPVGRQVPAVVLQSLVRSAAGTLTKFQQQTLQRRVIDEVLFENVAGRYVSQLRAFAGDSSQLHRRIDRTESELREVFMSLEMPLTWIHGDYWPGNLLYRRTGGARISGIVDWDRASQAELPLHDLLHLMVYSRKLRQSGSLGHFVANGILPRVFENGEWELLEQAGSQLGLPLTADVLRAMTLAYWARFVSEHLSRYPEFVGNRRWFDENVAGVLAAIAP